MSGVVDASWVGRFLDADGQGRVGAEYARLLRAGAGDGAIPPFASSAAPGTDSASIYAFLNQIGRQEAITLIGDLVPDIDEIEQLPALIQGTQKRGSFPALARLRPNPQVTYSSYCAVRSGCSRPLRALLTSKLFLDACNPKSRTVSVDALFRHLLLLGRAARAYATSCAATRARGDDRSRGL